MQIEQNRLLTGRSLLLFAIWAVAALGVLQTYRLEGFFGHAICGPWGCGPPVSALVGYHGFWLLLLMPSAWIAKNRLPSAEARKWGTRLWVVAAAGIISLLLVQGWSNPSAHKYLVQWCLFRLATYVDIPLVQLALAGLWLRHGTVNENDLAVQGAEDIEQ